MPRPTTVVVVFFLAMNLFAGVMVATGTDATLGIDTEVGADAAANSITGQQSNVPSGGGAFSTLFGMYQILTNFVHGIFAFVFPAVGMLSAAGVPSVITNQIITPLLSLVFVLDIVSFFRGWGI